MTKKLIPFCLILATFCACSDNFDSEQIADEYSKGSLTCPTLIIDEEFENVQVADLANGRFEINLGASYGTVQGTIDDSDITIQSYQGTSTNGVELDLSFGRGGFYFEENERATFKSITIHFLTPVEHLNICSLVLHKF